MRLTSHDGAAAELRLLGYERPAPPQGREDWDANWLYLAGRFTLPDGRSWSFRDACLTTWEARELGAWFRRVVSGVEPAAGDARVRGFTEPSLAVSLARRTDGVVTVRVHLAVEARPPWLDEDVDEHVLELSMGLAELARAADAWDEEIAAFPER